MTTKETLLELEAAITQLSFKIDQLEKRFLGPPVPFNPPVVNSISTSPPTEATGTVADNTWLK